MNKEFKKNKIAVLIFLGLVLILLAPNIVKAQVNNNSTSTAAQEGSNSPGVLEKAVATFTGNLITITFAFVSKIAFGVSWLISAIGGIGIAVNAWVLGFILKINSQIINSPPVILGFPISLSLANLFLVLAIVVIAIMTILRIQTYGIKQTLWKLIVIAIAINFGLVIAGVILQFFDSLSFYFLSSVDPGSGAGDPNQSGFKSFVNFASALAGAFNPQKSFWNVSGPSGVKPEDLAGTLGDSIGSSIVPITSMFFTILAVTAINIVLAALIIMLLIRYVYLSYLLILLPIAWVSWIFPMTKQNWDKWWHNFLKQASFAPLVLFFLWIAIQTSYAMSSADNPFQFEEYYKSSSNPVWAAISNFFTNLFSSVIKHQLQMAVMLGIMVGGIFAANSLGIKFAENASGAIRGAATGFGSWARTKSAGALSRAGASALQPPKTAPKPVGWKRFNPFSWAAYGATRAAQATVGRAAQVAQRTAIGQRVVTKVQSSLQSFGQRAAQSPGLAASLWGGIKYGSGLFEKKKKKRIKVVGKTASGESVKTESPEEESKAKEENKKEVSEPKATSPSEPNISKPIESPEEEEKIIHPFE